MIYSAEHVAEIDCFSIAVAVCYFVVSPCIVFVVVVRGAFVVGLAASDNRACTDAVSVIVGLDSVDAAFAVLLAAAACPGSACRHIMLLVVHIVVAVAELVEVQIRALSRIVGHLALMDLPIQHNYDVDFQ